MSSEHRMSSERGMNHEHRTGRVRPGSLARPASIARAALLLAVTLLLALPFAPEPAVAAAPATVSGPEAVEPGADIVVSGTGWTNVAGDAGSVIGVLIDARESGDPATVYTKRDIVNPAAGGVVWGDKRLHAIVQAEPDGSWTATIPYPTAENSRLSDGSWTDWEPGSAHQLRFLSGSLGSGDEGRTMSVDFRVTGGAENPEPLWPHDTVAFTDPTSGRTATAWIENQLPAGDGHTIRIAGTGWVNAASTGASTIALKLNSGPANQYTRSGAGIVQHPSASGDDTIWALLAPSNPSSHPNVIVIGPDGSFDTAVQAPDGLAAGQYLSALLQSGRFDAADTQRSVTSGFLTVGGVPYTEEGGETRPTCVPTQETATIEIHPDSLLVPFGGELRITGAGWCNPTPERGGSVIGVKIDEGDISRLDAELHQNRTIWAIVRANDTDGTIDTTITMPDGTDRAPGGSAPAIGDGTHTLRLLSGSLAPGDRQRTVQSGEFAIGVVRPGALPDPVHARTALVAANRGGMTATGIAGDRLRVTVPRAAPGEWTFFSAYVPDGSVRYPWGGTWLQLDAQRGAVLDATKLQGVGAELRLVAQTGEVGRTGELLGWTEVRGTDPRPESPIEVLGAATPAAAPAVAPRRAPASPTGPTQVPAPPVASYADLTHENVGHLNGRRAGDLFTLEAPTRDPGEYVYLYVYPRGGEPVGLGWVLLGEARTMVLDVSGMPDGLYRFTAQDETGELFGWAAMKAYGGGASSGEEADLAVDAAPHAAAVAAPDTAGPADLGWYIASGALLLVAVVSTAVPALRRRSAGAAALLVLALAVSGSLAASAPAHAIPAGGASPDTPGTASSVSPGQIPVGGVISFSVSGYPAGDTVWIKIDDGTGYCGVGAVYGACVVHKQAIDGAGNASGSFQLPPDLPPGAHWLRFLASDAGGGAYTRRGGADFVVVAGAGGASGGVAGRLSGARAGAGGAAGGAAESAITEATESAPLIVDLGEAGETAGEGTAASVSSADQSEGSRKSASKSAAASDELGESARAGSGDSERAQAVEPVDAEGGLEVLASGFALPSRIMGVPLGPIVFGLSALVSAGIFTTTLHRLRRQRDDAAFGGGPDAA